MLKKEVSKKIIISLGLGLFVTIVTYTLLTIQNMLIDAVFSNLEYSVYTMFIFLMYYAGEILINDIAIFYLLFTGECLYITFKFYDTKENE